MNWKYFIFLYVVFYQKPIMAQKSIFILKDSLTMNFVRKAAIEIQNIDNGENFTITTDNKGMAFFHNQSFPTRIMINIVADNYEPFKSDVLIIKGNDTITFNIIKKSNILDEVLIDDPRSIKYVKGKLTYYPKKSAFDKTQSITELFPAIPGFSKRNGQFYFRNESNFLILIDGVGENKSKDEQLAILANMPVNMISRIEFIDQPSIRYGNNITGIINVITKKNISYSVSKVSSSIQNFSDNGNANPPISLNGNLDSRFRVGKSNFQIAIRLSQIEQLNKKYNFVKFQPNQNIHQNTIVGSKANTIYPYFSVDHAFNKKLSGQVSTYLSFNRKKENGSSVYDYVTNNQSDSTIITRDLNKNNNIKFVITPQLKYVLDTLRDAKLYFNSNIALLGDDFENSYFLLNDDKNSAQNLKSRISSQTKIVYFDLIGENLINGKTLNLSAGTKFNLLKNNPRNEQSFKYEEFVNNIFVTSDIKLPKTTFSTGLRLEFLKFQNESDKLKSKQNLTNFFPSVTIKRDMGPQKNVSFGFQRNILRMSSIAYNKQILYKGYLDGIVGNNDLKPRITNYLYVQLYLKSHVLSINYKIHNNHRIFVSMDSLHPYIMRAINYNHFKQLYINYNKEFQLMKFWNSNLGLYCYFNSMDNDALPFRYRNAINYQIDWYNTLSLNSYSIELGLNYNSRYKSESGFIKPILYNNISISKVLKKNALNIKIEANDFLGISKDRSVLDLPLIYRLDRQLNNQQSFLVQLTYRFPLGKKSIINQYKSDLKDEIRN